MMKPVPSNRLQPVAYKVSCERAQQVKGPVTCPARGLRYIHQTHHGTRKVVATGQYPVCATWGVTEHDARGATSGATNTDTCCGVYAAARVMGSGTCRLAEVGGSQQMRR